MNSLARFREPRQKDILATLRENIVWLVIGILLVMLVITSVIVWCMTGSPSLHVICLLCSVFGGGIGLGLTLGGRLGINQAVDNLKKLLDLE